MKPVQGSDKSSRAINVPIIINALLLLDIQIRMSSSDSVNVLQRNREGFFSRRVKFDSGLNVMAVYEASRHGPKIVHSFTGQPELSHKVVEEDPSDSPRKSHVTLSLNWSRPYQGGCSSVPDLLQVF